MRNKIILAILTISIILSGCVDTGVVTKDNATGGLLPGKFVKANYFDKGPIINEGDFPGFKSVYDMYYIAPENLSLTLETEMGHGVYEMPANETAPAGYRIYAGSEAYNLSDRYILLQYKVFDSDGSLNDTIAMTAQEMYIKNGYKRVSIDKTYKGNVVVLESSNATNVTGMNVTIILFGFGTVIGKVGVQDSKGKSLDEALKILDIAFNRIHVKTKDVEAVKLSTIRSSNVSSQGNMSSNVSQNNRSTIQ